MSDYSDIEKRFRADTANHQMAVLHDDGLYRHLRFKAEDSGFYWFDLVTWPGSLAIRGDVDGYMFIRVTDMFEFFRMHRMHRTPRDGRLAINPHYWSEKVEGGRDTTKVYSGDLFKQLVIEHFKDAVQNREAPAGLGKAIRDDVLQAEDITHEEGARQVLRDFEYGEVFIARCLTCKGGSGEFEKLERAAFWEVSHLKEHPEHLTHVFTEPAFAFSDSWEWDLRDYDWSFLWACHAIVWGIAQYDTAKKTAAADSKVAAS